MTYCFIVRGMCQTLTFQGNDWRSKVSKPSVQVAAIFIYILYMGCILTISKPWVSKGLGCSQTLEAIDVEQRSYKLFGTARYLLQALR